MASPRNHVRAGPYPARYRHLRAPIAPAGEAWPRPYGGVALHMCGAGCLRGRHPAPHMRMRGLEPPRPYGHTDLNRARLPIPPHPRGRGILAADRRVGTRAAATVPACLRQRFRRERRLILHAANAHPHLRAPLPARARRRRTGADAGERRRTDRGRRRPRRALARRCDRASRTCSRPYRSRAAPLRAGARRGGAGGIGALALPARRQRPCRRPPAKRSRPAALTRPGTRGDRRRDVRGTPQHQPARDRCTAALGPGPRQRRGGDEDRRHRRRRRPAAPLLRPRGLHDARRLSQGPARLHDRQGDRGTRLSAARSDVEERVQAVRPAQLGARHPRRGDRGGQPEHSGIRREPDLRRRATGVHRQLQGSDRADGRGRRSRRKRGGARGCDRSGRRRRHGRDQPFDRRARGGAVARPRRPGARRGR